MPEEITFEDPPPNGREARASHAIVAAQLREKPGQWALVDRRSTARNAASTAYAIAHARGMRHYAPEGAFEAMSRTVHIKNPDGTRRTEYRVYSRYVGGVKPE